MPSLRREHLERYLRQQFGPTAELLAYGPIGEETSGSTLKGYGYGSPVRLVFRVGRRTQRTVLETMKPGPFGHEHFADRAQGLLWDFDSYGRLPRHVRALDVGAFAADGSMFSVAPAREFFVMTEWADGRSYHQDLERLARTGRLLPLDRARANRLVDYLVKIHRVRRRDPELYRRRLRELIGHGECIMGLTDSYPARCGFITPALLQAIEESCNRWRWRLRRHTSRLAQVHGDFHPHNVLFHTGRRQREFTVLDRSRGEWGEPADDLTAMTINYLQSSLCRWGTLRGPFEILFRGFWERYMERSGDRGVTETAAPFFAFRGLVVASPLWYPRLAMTVRRALFRFMENVLAVDCFDPSDVNKYCR
jgi:aminoglycoside phosphotransferase (APT) family kinase protein